MAKECDGVEEKDSPGDSCRQTDSHEKDEESDDGMKRQDARCKRAQEGKGRERGGEGETRAEDIAFWSRLEFGGLRGPSCPVNPRATPGGHGGPSHARPGPCDLPALQGTCLAALSRTGTSATP